MVDVRALQETYRTQARPDRGDLESALQNPGSVNTWSFPNNIEEVEHWMAFRINKQEFRRKNDFPLKNDIARIFLPIPLNLATQYTQSYNSEGIGVAGLAGAAFGAAGAGGNLQSLIDKVKGIDFKSVAQYYGLQAAEENVTALVGGTIGGIGGAITGAAAGQALKGAVAGAGLARNPYMAMLYDSPQFRTHQFTWKLLPKNVDEQEKIKQIIHLFKYHSSPDIPSNQYFFSYPEQFEIDFRYEDYLFNIGPSVLTSFQATYHAEGQPLYHNINDTKAPVSVNIDATFQEVTVITKENIKSQNR